jgi:hypothetical protein
MTATNHAITGALVATLLKEPLLAIPVAFVIHFVMDTIPHFGFKVEGVEDLKKRNLDKLFKKVLISDVAVAALLLFIIPIALSEAYSWWVVLACMIACISPDLVWAYRFYYEIRSKKLLPQSWLTKFHNYIQWAETPKGAIFEAAWFLVSASILLARV